MPVDASTKPELIVQGIPASPGIAYGNVFLYLKSDLEVPVYLVDPEKRVAEITRFEHALVVTREQIAKIRDEVEANLGSDEARIFDAHLLVLEDQALITETIREFEHTGRNIETCFNEIAQRYIKAFDQIDDEYLRERAGDLRDVTQRVLHNLLGQTSQNLRQLVGKRVVVAHEIAPSDAAGIDRSQAMGLVTQSGSKTSHAVIVARSMRVPAVVGVRDIVDIARDGDRVIVDGYDGLVILHPSDTTLFRYGQIRREKESFEQRLMREVHQPAITRDGYRVPLRANIESAEEVDFVKEHAGEGVGLFRTEFLYLSSPEVPTEEQLYDSYRRVASGFAPQAVTIRTLDLGGDKPMAGAPQLFPAESNPFLGFRAIRFCLSHRDIFKTQLRAILRASAHGNVMLMYPMISGTEELLQANAILAECQAELRAKGVAFDEKLQIGSMIEIPSAALTADALARHCDFFSIGTNDLIQYLLAIDRVNDRIAHLYEPTHPAVLRMIREIVNRGHDGRIKVSVCGEMAGDPMLVPLLIGLGVDELSMTPPLLPAAKYLIRAMKISDARRLAKQSLQLESPKEIHQLCVE
ncbi:MAG TPA: phosphoenolpyruvate--protein phosphotransferase, partial [Candidatus Synoicihabitans sp.]|nr:phosphoenolpyruvate--protein phosphotransferase [Candidatus Synoicihabitans sp.]